MTDENEEKKKAKVYCFKTESNNQLRKKDREMFKLVFYNDGEDDRSYRLFPNAKHKLEPDEYIHCLATALEDMLDYENDDDKIIEHILRLLAKYDVSFE